MTARSRGRGRAHERMNSFKSVALVNLRPTELRDAAASVATLEGHHEKSQGESQRVTQYFSFARRMTLI